MAAVLLVKNDRHKDDHFAGAEIAVEDLAPAFPVVLLVNEDANRLPAIVVKCSHKVDRSRHKLVVNLLLVVVCHR